MAPREDPTCPHLPTPSQLFSVREKARLPAAPPPGRAALLPFWRYSCAAMATIEIVDLTDEARFGLVPPCADQAFDHRTCDYWEDADSGSKASRPRWLPAGAAGSTAGAAGSTTGAAGSTAGAAGSTAGAAGSTAGSTGAISAERSSNPFAPPPRFESNPFAPPPKASPNPFAADFSADRLADNPFAPQRPARPAIAAEAPRKLQLLGRGLGIFGSYAKLLIVDGEAVAYCQFGPLSAYPRALRTRDLYPQLPQAPLPAVITCIATTVAGRGSGHALRLVAEVCRDLAGRGFAAVEAYPEAHAVADATPAAKPGFWLRAGFALAADDERYPVMRREL